MFYSTSVVLGVLIVFVEIFLFILKLILNLIVNVLFLDYIAIIGVVTWYFHTQLSYSIIIGLLTGFLIATIALAITRIKYLGVVITFVYSGICAYLFYLWLDDFWNCDNYTRKVITEIICSAVIIIWHFISLRTFGSSYFEKIGNIFSPITDTILNMYYGIIGFIKRKNSLDEDEEKLDAEVDEMFEKLGIAATSEPIINEENNS